VKVRESRAQASVLKKLVPGCFSYLAMASTSGSCGMKKEKAVPHSTDSLFANSKWSAALVSATVL
jgi:hypothetical protein